MIPRRKRLILSYRTICEKNKYKWEIKKEVSSRHGLLLRKEDSPSKKLIEKLRRKEWESSTTTIQAAAVFENKDAGRISQSKNVLFENKDVGRISQNVLRENDETVVVQCDSTSVEVYKYKTSWTIAARQSRRKHLELKFEMSYF